jgi:peptidoglycan/LPS O-acetylase OafA/YrhL
MTTGLLVVSSRDASNVLRRALSWKPLVTVGAFSYSFYLIHAPLLQLLWQYVAHPLGLDSPATFAVLMTLGLALVLAASYGFYRLLERPFLRRPRSTPAPAIVAVEPAA